VTAPNVFMANDPLHALLSRAHTGDPAASREAFEELLRLVKMIVRAGMGVHLRDARDSGDVCQSIAKSFIEDWRSRAIVFDSDAALSAYLRAVVRSKLAMLSRSDNALKRGGQQTTHGMFGGSELSGGPAQKNPSSSQQLESRERMEKVRAKLDPADLEIARLRLSGSTWEQIAERTGDTPDALRKRWSRLAQSLGEK
jgi:hypothetical protein